MSKTKTMSKKLKRLGKARGESPGASSQGGSDMSSETAQAEERGDPRGGTAVIPPVTDAMMDHAAHEAATLADGVAHHTVALDRASVAEAPEAAGDGMSSRASATEAPPDVTVPAPSLAAVAEAAQDLVEAAGAAVSGVSAAAVPPDEDATDGATRMAGAARDIPSASTDALSRYNATVFGMMRTNAASATALFAALVQARSVPEALSLNADHLRRQMETLTSQGHELATLAQRIARDALQPFKDPAER